MVSNKLERDMSPRDAVITFQCLPPDFVRVIERVGGESLQHREVPRHTDVVTELEERYIFFAKQAGIARKELRLGHSCTFNVYFRQP